MGTRTAGYGKTNRADTCEMTDKEKNDHRGLGEE
jgi:hypothetical protein